MSRFPSVKTSAREAGKASTVGHAARSTLEGRGSASLNLQVTTVGTLFDELAPHAERLAGPRMYADANVPRGLVQFMRTTLGWDVLFVMEHEDLRRAADAEHYRLAHQLHRTLVTMDRDYLDDRRFPPADTSGVIVIWAPNETLLARTLRRVHAALFSPANAATALPLAGRKLVADVAWTPSA